MSDNTKKAVIFICSVLMLLIGNVLIKLTSFKDDFIIGFIGNAVGLLLIMFSGVTLSQILWNMEGD